MLGFKEREFFEVEGPINMPRSPQGRPVLVQAGSSGPGMELGSSVADGIYTAQPLKEPSIEFYAKFKKMAAAKGRDPQQLKIIPGILPILGDMPIDAIEKQDVGRWIEWQERQTAARSGLPLSAKTIRAKSV